MESLPQQIPAKKNRFLRFIKRLFYTIVIFFVLLFGTVFCIGYFYQDEVKEFIIAELNKQLNTQIIVDGKDIEFTVIKNFPMASVDFKNVKALEVTPNSKKDTLFKAGLISFQFNLLDVLKKNYKIKHLALEKVKLRIRIDKKGNDNYHFLKSSNDTAKSNFAFALETIELNSVVLDYKNAQTRQKANVNVANSNLSGEFSNDKYVLQIEANAFINQLKIDTTFQLNNKSIYANTLLKMDNTSESYTIEKGNLKIEDMLFELLGNINAKGKTALNLSLKGKELNIQSFLSLMPEKYKKRVNDYESSGEFYFNSTINGLIAANEKLQINSEFGIKKAHIKHIKNDVALENVQLKGVYKSGKNNFLQLSDFSAQLKQGAVSGNLLIKENLFSGEIKANTSLAEINNLIKMDTLETIEGKVNADVVFSGKMVDIEKAK